VSGGGAGECGQTGVAKERAAVQSMQLRHVCNLTREY
jgi:hypothetical protein